MKRESNGERTKRPQERRGWRTLRTKLERKPVTGEKIKEPIKTRRKGAGRIALER